MVDQAEIHIMVRSEDWTRRKKAAEELENNFAILKDKEQACDDLHRLTLDNVWLVRRGVAYALGRAFEHVPDKKQAWNDLIRLTSDTDGDVRSGVAYALGKAFEHMPDKNQAWEDLHRLTFDSDISVRANAAYTLGSAFGHVPDKNQAWEDLHRLTFDSDISVRWRVPYALGIAFMHVPDKKQAWDDLHRLTSDIDSCMRGNAAIALRIAFEHVPDKKQAWDDLIRLTSDASVNGDTTAYALGRAFEHVIDKKQAWYDLHQLTFETKSSVRGKAAYALGIAFANVPDIKHAWEDLHRLTSDTHSNVRWDAADALGNAFAHILDKKQAWEDLHRLAYDTDSSVRKNAANALGKTFSNVPDKKQVWIDLHLLTSDIDNFVRFYAFHSLGKASIFKAANAENNICLKKETEAAIEYFEKSLLQGIGSESTKFCIYFCRSLSTLIFKKEEDWEAEVQRYLSEAKSARQGSKCKEKLLEAVENLVNALKEVQKARDFNIETSFNKYRQYYERVCELLEDTEKKAPDASRIIRKGLSIIDKRMNPVMSLDFLAKLENEIYDHIKDSTYRFQNRFVESNEKSNQVWVLKYFSPAYFQMFIDNGNKLYISRTSGFTWGDGVYVTSITNPYSSMIYGSIGVMGWIDINNPIDVFDACDKKGIDLYQKWITYTKGLYSYLTTTVHADWANRLLRNKFRKRFNIDLVIFHPDQYNIKYCDKKQDFWFLISDWRSGKPSYSDKVNDCKPLIVVGEQFEKMGPGLIYRDLIGKNLNYRSFQYHDPPSNKGKPNSSLISDLKSLHSQNNKIIIVRP